jgi:coatomer protein complex subunit epsilon
LQALALKAQYESMGGSDEAVLDALKTLAASSPTPAVQLTTAHVLLAAGQTKEALQQVFGGATMEHMSMILQIYLKLDRLDLAKNQLAALKQKDEDAVLTQLGSVYLSLAMGSSGAADGVHVLNSLTEQYGASPFLLNLMAAGLMIQGEYTAAETKLQECLRDFNEVVIPDTLVNMIVCSVQQNKSPAEFVSKLQMQFPSHPFNAGLERVTVAFDRESIKYKV